MNEELERQLDEKLKEMRHLMAQLSADVAVLKQFRESFLNQTLDPHILATLKKYLT